MLTTEIAGRPGNRYRITKDSIPNNAERLRCLAYLNGQNAADIVEHAQDGWEWAIEMLEGIAIDPFDISVEQAALMDRRTIREGLELSTLFDERNKRIRQSQGIDESANDDEPLIPNTNQEKKRKLIFGKYTATAIIRWLANEGVDKDTMVAIFEDGLNLSVADATYGCQTSALKRGAASVPTLDPAHVEKLEQLIEDYTAEVLL